MDLFDIPDDYRPEKPLTDEEMEDITNYLKGHPLFMKELPQNVAENQHLAALQSLTEEQDPITQAQNLNKQANKRLKDDPESLYAMKQAYKKYTEAINLKCNSKTTNAKLHCNRAAINFKLKNYGKVIADCKQCLKYDSEYVKGYYRQAKALLALGAYKGCVQLLNNRSQEELAAIKKQAQQKLHNDQQLQQQNHASKQFEQNQIEDYCKNKKWRYCKRSQSLPEGAHIQWIDGKISLPIVVNYPQFGQCDIIAATEQRHSMKQYLEQLLKQQLPWDKSHQYKLQTVQIYGQVDEQTLLRIPKQATIDDVASRLVLREALEILLVCRNNAYAKHYLSNYKII